MARLLPTYILTKVHCSQTDSVHPELLVYFDISVSERPLVVEVIGDGEVRRHLDYDAASMDQNLSILIVDKSQVFDPQATKCSSQQSQNHNCSFSLHCNDMIIYYNT